MTGPSQTPLGVPSRNPSTSILSPSNSIIQSNENLNNSQNQNNNNNNQKEIDPYQTRPPYPQQFKPLQVQQLLKQIIIPQLTGVSYDPDQSPQLAKDLASSIKNQLKQLNLPRYKFLVQVVLGENRGAGVRCGARCLWDQQTDKLADFKFQNVSLIVSLYTFDNYDDLYQSRLVIEKF